MMCLVGVAVIAFFGVVIHWDTYDWNDDCSLATAPETPVPGLPLLGGGKMPMSGLGLTGRDAKLTEKQVFNFLMRGGRHIDGALAYSNTKEMGAGIRRAMRCGVPREEVFVATKLLPHHFVEPHRWVTSILEDTGLGYIDLMLLHFPTHHTDYEMQVEGKNNHAPCLIQHQSWRKCWAHAWRALDGLRSAGFIRHLGVSNFGEEQVAAIQALGLAPVAVNQLEFHPWINQRHRDVVAWCHRQGIAVTAYCSVEPAMGLSPGFNVFPRTYVPSEAAVASGRVMPEAKHLLLEGLRKVASPHGRTVSQMLLRWAVQQNVSVIPGSNTPEHMLENLDIFGWELSAEDMAVLDSMPTAWGTSSRYPHVSLNEG